MQEDMNKFEDEMIITLEMEDGSETDCIVLAIFPMEENQYIALLPVEYADNDEDSEVFLYRYAEDEEGNPVLTDIEDDDEFDAVCDRFDEIEDEEDFDDLVPQDEN